MRLFIGGHYLKSVPAENILQPEIDQGRPGDPPSSDYGGTSKLPGSSARKRQKAGALQGASRNPESPEFAPACLGLRREAPAPRRFRPHEPYENAHAHPPPESGVAAPALPPHSKMISTKVAPRSRKSYRNSVAQPRVDPSRTSRKHHARQHVEIGVRLFDGILICGHL